MAGNAYSFKANPQQVEKIIHFYDYCKVTANNPNILFRAATNAFTIQIYTNYTVLIQGSKAVNEYAIWQKMEDGFAHMGSDEVGTGDYFGPIVVACCLVQEADYPFLNQLGVKDSKQLDDKKIRLLAPLLMKRLKAKVSILSNTKYNQIYHSDHFNLNVIKSYLHNFLIAKLKEETKFEGPIIIDQFCDEELYFKYLKDYKATNVIHDVSFYIKAENQFMAVACASIIARYEFLKRMDQMSVELKRPLLKGASNEVDQLAIAIAKEHGLEYLKKYVKYNFANTKKVLKALQ